MIPFEFRLDRPNRLLHTIMRGFWDLETVVRYECALFPKLRALDALRPGTTLSLVDSVDFPVQDRAVTASLGEVMLKRAGRLHPDRTAIVVGNALQKMQVSRHVVDDRVHLFVGEAEALAWLLQAAPRAKAA